MILLYALFILSNRVELVGKSLDSKTIELTIVTSAFDRSAHEIERKNGHLTIDGRHPFGTDNDCCPMTQTDWIQLTVNGQTIEFPKELIADLYELGPNDHGVFEAGFLESGGGDFLIVIRGGDAGGSYVAVFLVMHDGRTERMGPILGDSVGMELLVQRLARE